MDELRIEAILACFSTDGVPPEQKYVEKLKENPKLDPDEADDLLDRSITAFNNFKAFSDSPAAYVAELKKKTRQKVFVQRLAGLPEDPMPDKDEASDPETKAAVSAANAKPVRGMALPDDDDLLLDGEEPPPALVPSYRQVALHNLFDRFSKVHKLMFIDEIGTRVKPEKGDELVLSPEVIDQMKMFAENGDDYVADIDAEVRPDLNEEELSLLKALLTQLAKNLKAPPEVKPSVPPAEPVVRDVAAKPEAPVDAVPAASARAPTTRPAAPAKPAADAVAEPEAAAPAEKKPIVVHSLPVPPQEPPAWARKVMQMSYWKTARECIETAYVKTNDPNPDVRAKGTDDLAHWQKRMREHKDGCSGPELELFGDYMYKLMRDLKSGVDPFSEAYVRMYVNP